MSDLEKLENRICKLEEVTDLILIEIADLVDDGELKLSEQSRQLIGRLLYNNGHYGY